MTISAETAMRQAGMTALEYFDTCYQYIDSQCPEASQDAKLDAAVRLAQVAVKDYELSLLAGLISGTVQNDERYSSFDD
ncbi:MAG: hypothetical protein AB4041_13300 [Microcystaceae cyanobacterium]